MNPDPIFAALAEVRAADARRAAYWRRRKQNKAGLSREQFQALTMNDPKDQALEDEFIEKCRAVSRVTPTTIAGVYALAKWEFNTLGENGPNVRAIMRALKILSASQPVELKKAA